jgi:chemotaxis protein CheD
MPDENHHVRISEMKVLRGSGTLVILGLGSCVGLFVRDPETKVAGCAHVMLPDSQAFSTKPSPAKFADTAVPALVQVMIREGADIKRMEAKLTGGAAMFATASSPNLLPLGLRNVMGVREALRLIGIPLKVEDIGGLQGRTVYFQVGDGKLLVKRVHQPDAWY